MTDNPKTKYAMAKDPVHVGTGGYKLGRVDNTIVREPGTKIPKIPGSTLNGSARTYSYYHLKEDGEDVRKACALGKETEIEKENGKTEKQSPCGDCKICKTYGHAEDEEGNSKRSKVNFSDARILLFPVHSMKGPVWVTCPSILEDAEIDDSYEVEDENVKTDVKDNKINLGWLYLNVKAGIDGNLLPEEIPEKIEEKIAIVSDKVFSQVVNSNLEVRTSVSIDPETGAAEQGALFTYEAIPRGTIFWFDITTKENDDKTPDIVEEGLKKFETLGVGGMTSRGLGRVKVFGTNCESEGGSND